MLQGEVRILTLRSPSKLNLFLRVLRKREDGYHEIASLFQTVDLFDLMHFRKDEKDLFTCSDPSIPIDGSNLVLKALKLFRQKTGKDLPVRIDLEKRIPIQAGLGGGSSNAATTLFALNQLFETEVPTELLAAWSSEIGSDVPFFFSLGTAFCTGRGEKVQNLPKLFSSDLLLIKPKFGLSTPQVFKTMEVGSLPERSIERILNSFYEEEPQYFNDLEFAAFQLKPELKKLRQELVNQGFTTVQMTGSGTAFFCLGNGEKKIKDLFSCQVRFLNRNKDAWY